ncbi:long-chain-fatty-acid-CoA ligase [Multifurca ochricompacta]|uniref:Long-chain-fatty-acid-CoA ligase n=1 Tax=Multifurca ochricompacta TaxID=376703 RepID=A0AAD4MAF9_9AGAM|nr:long-chain-fatty-acid-CoA ligase [Multifurca ochricompacta]
MAVLKVVPVPGGVDFKKQALQVPGTKRPGQTAIFGYVDLNTPDTFSTLPEVFNEGYALSKDHTFLGYRPVASKSPLKYADHYVWQTYAEVDERRRNLGSAIHALFENGTVGGDWVLIDLALNAYGKVTVSLYDTLGDEAVGTIDHAHVTLIFTTSYHLAGLLKVAPRHPHLKFIVVIDELEPEAKLFATTWSKAIGVKLEELSQLEEFGKKNRRDIILPSPSDVATICYTSGTTSMPKGVLLTHGNLALAAQSNLYGYPIGPEERVVLLSYLPLAHIYERVNQLAVMAQGGAVGFFSGDPLLLLEDAQTLKPNFFPSVPRVLNRIYQAAMVAGNASGLKGAIFRRAMRTKLDNLHDTGVITHPLWDRLVFKKIQAVLGGNVRLIVSGSAPISGEVIEFLKIAFACEVTEGDYGMTENTAVCTRSTLGDPTSAGTVGPPQPAVEMKLVDVPAMNYTAEDKPFPRGEICCRGPTVFTHYYKAADEGNTKEAVEADGWVHTGDIGEVDECGRFRVIDRIKNIMKLAQGEYVALEKIENLYSRIPLAMQVFVHGNSLKSYLIGIIVVDPVQFAAFASRFLERTIDAADVQALKELCGNPRIVDGILAELNKHTAKSLKGFEQLKRIHLTCEPFSIDDNTLTPTLKLRRRDAYNKYKAVLDSFYELPDPSLSGSGFAKL